MANISQYKLPVKQPERNFPHVVEEHFFSLSDIEQGDTAGTTDTDSKTDPENKSEGKAEGYTRIYR